MVAEEQMPEVSGISAGKLALPVALFIMVLHIIVITLVLMIGSSTSRLSLINQNAGRYSQDATSLLAGTSLLSETAGQFVLTPVPEGGEPDISSLYGFAQEMLQDRRGRHLKQRFATYDVPEKAVGYLSVAAECADSMLDSQLHAIELVRSVYPIPEIPQLASIPRYPLTEEELGMKDEERLEAARSMLLSAVYALNKQSVSQNGNACAGIIQEAYAGRAAALSKQVTLLRFGIWFVTTLILITLIGVFFMIYMWLIRPLGGFAHMIPEGSALDDTTGFREVRLVAAAYNVVRKRRDKLDSILRSAAETDALTGLPNRYSFEQYLMEADESGGTLAVLLFDVNYLKQTNDIKGHLAGDRLLIDAADCIRQCFGSSSFRFGGDEFAAVVRDCTPESIEEMLRGFRTAEKEKNISISCGYAYTTDIGNTSFKDLMDEADRNMYMNKKRIHAEKESSVIRIADHQ